MSECAHKALHALLRKAEGAWARGSERRATLAFTDGSFPDYLNLPNREARGAAHAVLRNAERRGAIGIEWDRYAGEDGQIERVRLLDAEALAGCLEVEPLWRICEAAARALALTDESPAALRAVYAAWCAGKAPRKLGPDRVQDFVDAQRVIDACRERGQVEDIPLRRLSVELFRDTKRIEAITPALDALSGDLSNPRVAEEVWAALGLVKFPQPLLCAGKAVFRLGDATALALPSPYLGVPTGAVEGVSLPQDCAYLLSVENLTTFNELARGRGGVIEGLVIYTGGMPSPSLLAIYRRIVAAVPQAQPIWHWGDIDLGGFRIAAALRAEAQRQRRDIALFNMNPSALVSVPNSGSLGPNEVRDMLRIARANGWIKEAEGIEASPLAYEQEALTPMLPRS